MAAILVNVMADVERACDVAEALQVAGITIERTAAQFPAVVRCAVVIVSAAYLQEADCITRVNELMREPDTVMVPLFYDGVVSVPPPALSADSKKALDAIERQSGLDMSTATLDDVVHRVHQLRPMKALLTDVLAPFEIGDLSADPELVAWAQQPGCDVRIVTGDARHAVGGQLAAALPKVDVTVLKASVGRADFGAALDRTDRRLVILVPDADQQDARLHGIVAEAVARPDRATRVILLAAADGDWWSLVTAVADDALM